MRPNPRQFRVRSLLSSAALGLSIFLAPVRSSPAGETASLPEEERLFSILVDGKPAGTYRLTVSRGKNGETVAQYEADVSVRFLLFNYGYRHRGREVWYGDQLVQTEAQADDGGKKSEVAARLASDGSSLLVNGQARKDASFHLTTSYWRLPAGAGNPQSLRVVDLDTGRLLSAQLALVGWEQLQMAGSTQVCAHYRVSGDAPTDLWYDQQGRIIRQESIEKGHRSEIVLSSIRRPAALSMR